jgi:hypothetical protein
MAENTRKATRAAQDGDTLDDSDLSKPAFSNVCVWCTHWEPSMRGHYCAAFPRAKGKQIPDGIWLGKSLHMTPVAGQGNDVTFDAAPEGVETMKKQNPALAKAWAEKEARGE